MQGDIIEDPAPFSWQWVKRHRQTAIALVVVVGVITSLAVDLAFKPSLADLAEERIATHCLPIASETLFIPADQLVVTGKALARCWVTTPFQSEHVIWYGIYDNDPYGWQRER